MSTNNWESGGPLPSLSELADVLEPLKDQDIAFDVFCKETMQSLFEALDLEPGDKVVITKEPVNVGTIGHCDYGKTILKTIEIGPTMSIDTRKILVICAGMGMVNSELLEYCENDTGLSLSTHNRRYIIHAPDKCTDYKPEKLNDRQSWQSMNRGEYSKKQRRKL